MLVLVLCIAAKTPPFSTDSLMTVRNFNQALRFCQITSKMDSDKDVSL